MTAWDKEHSNQWWCRTCHATHDSPDCPVEPQKCADYVNDIDQYRGNTPFARPSSVPDEVDHPKHYARWPMEPIEFIAINNLPWWLANLIKYGMRYDAKNGLEDLYKARSYLDIKIRQLEGIKRFWEKPVAEERKLNAGR